MWAVTHLPTGLRIASRLPTKGSASKVADVALATHKGGADIGSSDQRKASAGFDVKAIDAQAYAERHGVFPEGEEPAPKQAPKQAPKKKAPKQLRILLYRNR